MLLPVKFYMKLIKLYVQFIASKTEILFKRFRMPCRAESFHPIARQTTTQKECSA